MRRPLAPTLATPSEGTPDPVKALADRQRQAIDKRVQGAERARIEGAGVDGASTPPKAGKTGSPPALQPKPTSTGGSQGSASAASAAKPQPSTATSSNTGASASEPAAPQSTEDASTPSQSSDTTDEPGEGEQSGPQYDLKGLKRWAEENPEAAVEAAKSVFGIDVDASFIRLQNRARKIKTEIREQRTKVDTDAQTKLTAAEAARTQAEQVAQQLRPMADMWAAAQRKDERGQPVIDFDTADECFRLNMGGVTVDEYMRQRARRGITHPELARERAARLRLEAELAQLKNTQGGNAPEKTNGAAERTPAAAVHSQNSAAPAAPTTNPAELWGDEIPKRHPLREFRGWETELHAEMQRFYDETLDEYSADPEEIAGKLLERKLAALRPQEDEPAPAQRAPAKRPSTPKRRRDALEVGPDGLPDPAALAPRTSRQQPPPPRGHRPATAADLSDEGPTDLVSRERWALERAQKRMRGEL